jgi:methylated-DNA-[protein]-cysteine S-methyltransferase
MIPSREGNPMKAKHQVFVSSPFGPFRIWGNDKGVVGASFAKEVGEDSPDPPPHMEAAKRQAEAYFEGSLTTFDLPIEVGGTDFQRRVWNELRRIPFGETRTYGQVAKTIGIPDAARAVGGACRSNPVGVIVPCHRVIGADGGLVGFGGQSKELGLKKGLLDLETAGLSKKLTDY